MNSEQISNGAENMSTGFFYHYPDFRFLFQKKIKKCKIGLAILRKMCYFIIAVVSNIYPGVAQLVARLTGGQEAVSSSLATRTKRKPRNRNGFEVFSFSVFVHENGPWWNSGGIRIFQSM